MDDKIVYLQTPKKKNNLKVIRTSKFNKIVVDIQTTFKGCLCGSIG